MLESNVTTTTTTTAAAAAATTTSTTTTTIPSMCIGIVNVVMLKLILHFCVNKETSFYALLC